jgi:hypothetical protein
MDKQICYLCGKEINGRISGDHVPPAQFFPSQLRQSLSPNLLKLPTHYACNCAYQKDEDYFISSFFPITENSTVHNFLLEDIKAKLERKESKGFYNLIMNEFIERPSGLYLPNDKILKRIDGQRVKRITWKILRGLHYHIFKEYLAGDKIYRTKFFQSGDSYPEGYYKIMGNTELTGDYKEVFCYRVQAGCFLNPKVVFYAYSLIFWNSIEAFTFFHEPC